VQERCSRDEDPLSPNNSVPNIFNWVSTETQEVQDLSDWVVYIGPGAGYEGKPRYDTKSLSKSVGATVASTCTYLQPCTSSLTEAQTKGAQKN
jgi:hypothetical protein